MSRPGGSQEFVRDDGEVVGGYGPNPYGMMGQNWIRAWIFDPSQKGPNGGNKCVGTAVFAPGNWEKARRFVESKASKGGE